VDEIFVVTVMNTGSRPDPYLAFRIQQLVRQLGKRLGLVALEVRVELPTERRERRARREDGGGVQCGKPVPRQTATRG
jgi:hypothetical protein